MAKQEANAAGERPETIAQRVLEDELSELRNRVDGILSADPAVREDAADLQARLAELTTRIESLRHHQEREERLLDISTQAASQGVSNMTGMVEFLAILFTLVLFGVTLITGLHTKELREEWHRVEDALKATSEHAGKAAETAKDCAVKASQDILQKANEAKNQLADLAKEWEEKHREHREQHDAMLAFSTKLTTAVSDALKAILAEVTHQAPFSSEATKRIERKIQVFSAQLKIIHPEARIRRVGIDELGASGTKDAEVILRRLLEVPNADGQEALQIQRALKQNADALRLALEPSGAPPGPERSGAE
ncbi:MAG TPA: hypothetical protein VLE27_14215 [Thermoanaerobaculia bacterium]|nr:hypothetical protein [Thermoanaerobaculia bacterium]